MRYVVQVILCNEDGIVISDAHTIPLDLGESYEDWRWDVQSAAFLCFRSALDKLNRDLARKEH